MCSRDFEGRFNWKEVLPYSDESRKIEELIKVAQTLEAKDNARAISMYREAIVQIIAFDKAESSAKAARRRVQYPVNRLSLLLEKCGELQSAQEVILQYEQFNDVFGLTSAEKKSVDARKQRLVRKLDVAV
jgi:hypothetical protein